MSFNPPPIFYTADVDIVVNGNISGEFVIQSFGAILLGDTKAIYFMPTFDCEVFGQNNVANLGTTTTFSLYNADGQTLIGSGSDFAAPVSLGQVLANNTYMIQMYMNQALPFSGLWFSQFTFLETLSTRTWFPDGIEVSPLLPVPVVALEQLYGNFIFECDNFLPVAGQQYTFCFADVASTSGTLVVSLAGFGATGIFTAYAQPFVQYNSIIVVLTANNSTPCPLGSQVLVSLAGAGTTAQRIVAPIKNSSVFASSFMQAQAKSQEAIAQKKAYVKAIRASTQRSIMPPPTIAVASISMNMSEDEDVIAKPERKHKRIY